MTNTTIILLRHGEKHEWLQGRSPTADNRAMYQDNHLLSCKGRERAAALSVYLRERHEIASLLAKRPLAAVVAQAVDNSPEQWGRSERPLLTVLPLVADLNNPQSLTKSQSQSQSQPQSNPTEPVELIELTKSEWRKFMELVLSGRFDGRTVICSWSHQQLPQIVVGLGVPDNVVPRKWQGKRYDITWIVELNDGQVPSFKQLPQLLMYGDEDSVMPLSGKSDSYDD
eukprot:jgi/Hompol1/1917/HPOL_002796-RA